MSGHCNNCGNTGCNGDCALLNVYGDGTVYKVQRSKDSSVPILTSHDVQLQMLDRIEELEEELARVKENLRVEREIAVRDQKRIAGITAICKEMFK